MEKRDLGNDLEICEAATPGPWEIKRENIGGSLVVVSIGPSVLEAEALADDSEVNIKTWLDATNDDIHFFVEAREGWPHAIKRALEAEEKVEQLSKLCRVVIDKILPNESVEKCDIRRDWANERLKEIMGNQED